MATYQTVRETEGGWTSPEMAIVHDVRISAALVDPNLEEDLEHFQTRNDDVFVASYPKSGKLNNLELDPRKPRNIND